MSRKKPAAKTPTTTTGPHIEDNTKEPMTTADGKIRASLHLSSDGKFLFIKTLLPERTKLIGFGRYLLNYDPKEIQVTVEALKVLKKGKERRGVQGMEFFYDNTLAWGDASFELKIPINSISMTARFKEKYLPHFVQI